MVKRICRIQVRKGFSVESKEWDGANNWKTLPYLSLVLSIVSLTANRVIKTSEDY